MIFFQRQLARPYFLLYSDADVALGLLCLLLTFYQRYIFMFFCINHKNQCQLLYLKDMNSSRIEILEVYYIIHGARSALYLSTEIRRETHNNDSFERLTKLAS